MAGFSVNAAVLEQNGQKLYLFPLRSDVLRRISYVVPRSDMNPQEIQRLISQARVIEIGEYIKEPTSILPGSVVISVGAEVTVTDTGLPDVQTLHFPETEGKFAYILDGQHRVEGFRHSGGIEFDLPVVALHNASEALRVRVFADINSKQRAVSKVQLDSLYHQINAGTPDETHVRTIVERLNTDADSPLRTRVQILDRQKDTWVRNVGLKTLIAPYVTGGGVLARKPTDTQVQILKAYFDGARKTWPTEWGDNGHYVLTRPLGFEMMFYIFRQAIARIDMNWGRQYTGDNFKLALDPLKEAQVNLVGIEPFELEWAKGSMAMFANAAMRKKLGEELVGILVAADEDIA